MLYVLYIMMHRHLLYTPSRNEHWPNAQITHHDDDIITNRRIRRHFELSCQGRNTLLCHAVILKAQFPCTLNSPETYHLLTTQSYNMHLITYHTHTHTHNCFTAPWILSGTTRVSRYQKKYSPTHSYHGHRSPLICLIHLIWSMAPPPSVQSKCPTISLQVFFGLPLGLAPPTSYCIHFFTQSFSSFHNTCPYHHSLYWYYVT